MKKILVLVATVALLGATVTTSPKAAGKIDYGENHWVTPVRITYNPANLEVILEDSAVNQYGMWTQMQDPLTVVGNNIIFVNRMMGDATLGSGALGIIFTTDAFGSYVHDWPINDGLLNDPHPGTYLGRYPSSWYHTSYPGASWPELTTAPGWGFAGLGNEPDWSSTGFYGVFSDDIHVHKVWGKMRDDGKVAGIAIDNAEPNNVYSFVYDPDMGDFAETPAQVSALYGYYPDQLDYYNGLFMAIGSFQYATSNDGVNWNAPVDISPAGFPEGGTIGWNDGVINFDGTGPLCVIDYSPDTGSLFVEATEVWFYSPDTAVRIDVGMDTYNHYPQLVIDRTNNVLVAIWAEANSNEYDSTILGWWWDIYASRSEDGGLTWSTPVNLTNTPDVNEVMPQVARCPDADGNVWIVYLTALDGTNGDLYNGVRRETSFDVYNARYHIAKVSGLINVEENASPGTEKPLLVVHNLRHENRIKVSFIMEKPGNARIALYNEAGRAVLVKEASYGKGTHELLINTSSIPSGIYFVKATTPTYTKSVKVMVVH